MIKDPDAELDYAVNWSNWLEEGETIVSAVWEIPDSFTRPPGKPDRIEEGRTIIWVSGGEPGMDHGLRVHVVTSAGREEDRTIWLRVRNR